MVSAYAIEHCIITPLRHPLLKLKRVTLRDIARYPVITYYRVFNAGPLFSSSLACISLRRGQYRRGYAYDFIARVAPKWTHATVDHELRLR